MGMTDEQEEYEIREDRCLRDIGDAGYDGYPFECIYHQAERWGVALSDAFWVLASDAWHRGKQRADDELRWVPGVNGSRWANGIARRDGDLRVRVTVTAAGNVLVEEVNELNGQPVRTINNPNTGQPFTTTRAVVAVLRVVRG